MRFCLFNGRFFTRESTFAKKSDSIFNRLKRRTSVYLSHLQFWRIIGILASLCNHNALLVYYFAEIHKLNEEKKIAMSRVKQDKKITMKFTRCEHPATNRSQQHIKNTNYNLKETVFSLQSQMILWHYYKSQDLNKMCR